MINYEGFRAEALDMNPQVVRMYKNMIKVIHRGDTSTKGVNFHLMYNQLVSKYS